VNVCWAGIWHGSKALYQSAIYKRPSTYTQPFPFATSTCTQPDQCSAYLSDKVPSIVHLRLHNLVTSCHISVRVWNRWTKQSARKCCLMMPVHILGRSRMFLTILQFSLFLLLPPSLALYLERICIDHAFLRYFTKKKCSTWISTICIVWSLFMNTISSSVHLVFIYCPGLQLKCWTRFLRALQLHNIKWITTVKGNSEPQLRSHPCHLDIEFASAILFTWYNHEA
jgi:hypothetical protein